jgi:hypothetical protein
MDSVKKLPELYNRLYQFLIDQPSWKFFTVNESICSFLIFLPQLKQKLSHLENIEYAHAPAKLIFYRLRYPAIFFPVYTLSFIRLR